MSDEITPTTPLPMLQSKQQAFVDAFVKTGDPEKAYRMAGYKTGSALKVMASPQVLQAITRKQEERRVRLALDEDYELLKSKDLVEMCSDPDSDRWNPIAANASLALMAKIRGKLVTKVQVGIADNLSEDLERIDEKALDGAALVSEVDS